MHNNKLFDVDVRHMYVLCFVCFW